ncbi:MAG: hypothetical protein AAB407_01745 [Patescibacteria group bacterium]
MKNKILLIGIGGVVIAIGIFLLPTFSNNGKKESNDSNALEFATTSNKNDSNEKEKEIVYPKSGQEKNIVLPVYTGEDITAIGSDPFIASLSQELKNQYIGELNDLKLVVTNNPNNFDAWMRIGIIKVFFNNYFGARDVWEYTSIIFPKNSLSYLNLGNLYSAHLKDNQKAEQNYLRAINNDPSLPQLYVALADFYWTFDGQKKEKAVAIIQDGLKRIPEDVSLLNALKFYSAQ